MTLETFRSLVLVICFFSFCNINQADAGRTKYKRSVENYTMPDVVLVNQNGTKVRFKELMQTQKPVIVNFIFATCTTICPVLSAGYVNLQQKIGPELQNAMLISISIDPENDTPKIMKEYLKRYRAKPGWDFFTGSRRDIDSVMRAFDAYIPNKMSHFPLTLMRPPGDGKWNRIFGLMNSSEFVGEYQKMISK
jgi:protein SCO1/2